MILVRTVPAGPRTAAAGGRPQGRPSTSRGRWGRARSAQSSVKVSMAATGDWVPDVTREAMRRLLAHAEKVRLPNTDECTLRAFFMAAAHDLLGTPWPRFQTEWSRFDVLVQIGTLATIIEFKYYMRRRTFGLGGKPLSFKGGPGPKNEAEFNACLEKLCTAVPTGVGDRRLILVYEREANGRSRYSFDRSYGGLAVGDDVTDVQSLAVGPLEGRVLRPRWRT
jgi:hypothetical protein